jgi:hypothetical protein
MAVLPDRAPRKEIRMRLSMDVVHKNAFWGIDKREPCCVRREICFAASMISNRHIAASFIAGGGV